ncbi:predicted protein [Naegleria gruberi]|uniref:Predicted protein n=1 Tax=Naegleria gruberi TaxID=5762 RepID=D2VQC9_NAEGR|nr:uncharacterized protein NAEGRDRAFT_71181 [Naegleria gruberi]EFC40851.1 predicted protein [Naegleria gruberi]|eukprot:XP_002673595.1 predicted protein [Naegleria gruberi strain NEG-M]
MCQFIFEDDDKESRSDYEFSRERKILGSICSVGFCSVYIILFAVILGVNISWSTPPTLNCSISSELTTSLSTQISQINLKRNIFNHYIDISIDNNLFAKLKSRSVLGYPMTIDLTSNKDSSLGDSYALDEVGTSGHNLTIRNCNGTFIGNIKQQYDSVWSDFIINNFNSRPIMKITEKRQISPKEFYIYDYDNSKTLIGTISQNPAAWGDGMFLI